MEDLSDAAASLAAGGDVYTRETLRALNVTLMRQNALMREMLELVRDLRDDAREAREERRKRAEPAAEIHGG